MTTLTLFPRKALAIAVLATLSATSYAATTVDTTEFTGKQTFTEETIFSAPSVSFAGKLEANANLTFNGDLISTFENGDINPDVINASDVTTNVAGSMTTVGGLHNEGTLIVGKDLTAYYLATKGNVTVGGKTTVTSPLGTNQAPSNFGGHSSNTNIGTFTTGEFEYSGSFANYGTMTVQSGNISVVASYDGKTSFFNGGTLYLQAKEAKIDAQSIHLYGGVISMNETEGFDTLTMTGYMVVDGKTLTTIKGNLVTGDANILSDLTVEGSLTATPQAYDYILIGSNVKTQAIVSKNGVKVGTTKQGTLTTSEIYAPGMLRVGSPDSSITVTEKVEAGSIFNLGEFNAQDAVIELSGNKSVNGYVFVNGNDKDLEEKDITAATATIGTLIAHGNVLNISDNPPQERAGQSVLIVRNLQADILDNRSVVTATGGEVNVKSVEGESGKINLSDATISVEETSSLGEVTAEKGSQIELGSGEYTFTKVTSSDDDTTLVLNDLSEGAVTLNDQVGKLRRVASKQAVDNYASPDEAAAALVKAFDQNSAEDDYSIQRGTVADGLDFKVDDKGDIVGKTYTKNEFVDGFGSVSYLSVMQWRHEINSLNKRMGELRNSPAGIGSWVRLYGSEMEYGAQNVTSKNTTIQVGSDVSVGDWKFGIAANYTDGDSSYDNGQADTKNYGIALYGSWLAPCGGYLDLIAKYARLENDFVMNSHKGSYDNNALSLSAELGHHFKFLEDRVFVEPQLGVSYGYINSSDFTTGDNIRIEQDSFTSLIGRVGVRTGFTFPNNKGSVYARVSGVYDFKGELDSSFALLGTASKNVNHADLGGSWVEYGIGANFNWTENTYTYVDLERTSGGEVKENYRWNIGLRHTF